MIVLNYNGGQIVSQCVDSVLMLDYPNYEIVIVDNGSTDGSAESLFARYSQNPKLILVRNKTNLGYAEGYNSGIPHTSGDYLIFLNNDVIVPRNWVSEIVRVMEEDAAIALCQSDVLDMRSKSLQPVLQLDEFAGFFANRSVRIESPVTQIFSCYGVASVARRSVLDEIGAFDPAIFIYQEIGDLCWRARLAGYKVVHISTVQCLHVGRLGQLTHWYDPNLLAILSFHSTKNTFLVLLKNARLRKIVTAVACAVVLRGLELVMLASRGYRRFFIAKLKGLLWVITHFPLIWRQRLIVRRKLKRASDAEIERLLGRLNPGWVLRHKLALDRLYRDTQA